MQGAVDSCSMHVAVPIKGAERRNRIAQIISTVPVLRTFSDFIYFFTTNSMRLCPFLTAKDRSVVVF